MAAMLEPTIDARLLATLLIPQLEMYLATNLCVRFLVIQYPPSHLPIVLALRDLIGTSLMRVTGLLNSNAEPATFPSRLPNPLSKSVMDARRQRFTRILEDDYMADIRAPPIPARAPGRPSIANEMVTFARTNYLLPSGSNELEIKSFLDGIFDALVQRSLWYAPEPPTFYPPPPPAPPSRGFSLSRAGSHGRSGLSLKAPKSILMNAFSSSSSSGPRPGYASSIASSIRTVTTTYTTATEKSRKHRERAQSDKDWENFYIASEDEDDDDWDRMVMGRRLARIVPTEIPKPGEFRQTAPTKKALKWLGLA